MEDFKPRPDASKRVAAAKRAQLSDDPEPATPLTSRAHRYVPFGVGALVLVLLMIGMGGYQLAQLPARPLAITPSAQAFEKDPVAAPVAAQDGPRATEAPERTIAAYAAPDDGARLGPVELWRIPTVPIAHYGSDWIQHDVTGSGLVWFKQSDLHAVIAGPDLMPPTPVPQIGRGMTIYRPGATPTPPPAVAPSYIENVGAQVRHSPRGGLCGPTGGDCAPGVPFGVDGSQYLANVGQQVPHKVR